MIVRSRKFMECAFDKIQVPPIVGFRRPHIQERLAINLSFSTMTG